MKTFRSKYGYRLMVFLLLVFGGIMGAMIYQKEPYEALVAVAAIVFLVMGFCLYLNFATSYTIEPEGTLWVQCGPLYNKRFDIAAIKSVARSSNFVASPAPSLDRIELAYGKFEVLVISPKNELEFVAELTRLNPDIVNKIADQSLSD